MEPENESTPPTPPRKSPIWKILVAMIVFYGFIKIATSGGSTVQQSAKQTTEVTQSTPSPSSVGIYLEVSPGDLKINAKDFGFSCDTSFGEQYAVRCHLADVNSYDIELFGQTTSITNAVLTTTGTNVANMKSFIGNFGAWIAKAENNCDYQAVGKLLEKNFQKHNTKHKACGLQFEVFSKTKNMSMVVITKANN